MRGCLIPLLGAFSAFAPLATDMDLSGFPAIAADLHRDTAGAQLSLSNFFLGLCMGQLGYGPLTDAWGRRRPLRVGIWIFTVSSAMCLLCRGIDMFIGVRLLHPIGGCAGMIIARAVIQDLMHGRDPVRALSTLMVVHGRRAGARAGAGKLPAAGRGLEERVRVPDGAWRRLPVRDTRGPARDTAGAVAAAAEIAQHVRRIRDAAAHPGLRAAVVEGQFRVGGDVHLHQGSPFALTQLYGLSQRQYGWLFALNACGMIVGAQLNRRLLRRHSPVALMRVAALLMLVAGLLLYALCRSAALWPLLGPLFVLTACVPVVAANASALAMDAGHERAGSASSLLGAVQFGLAAVASGPVGSFGTGTAAPMVTVMLAGAVLATTLAWWPHRSS